MSRIRLGDVAERLNIKVDQATTDLEFYIGGEHIESSEFTTHYKALIKGSTIGYQFQFGFRKGDILFMTKNPHLRKCTMATFDGLCSIATFVIHTKSDLLLQDYLLFEMQSDRFWQYCEDHKSGGVNYFINWGTLSDYEFDLPSIEEQKVLADKLWAAYKVKESYRQLLSTTDEMLKAKFQEMFGDVVNSTIHNIAKVVSGKSIPTKLEDIVGPVAYVKVADFNLEGNEKYITTSSRFVTKENANLSKNVPIGSILFAKNGAAAMSNKKRLTKIDCCIDMNTLAVIPNKAKALPEFLLAFFESINIADHVRQGAIPSISPKDIENIALHLPPMELQQKFAEIATQAEATKASLRASIEAIDRVIKSLINQ